MLEKIVAFTAAFLILVGSYMVGMFVEYTSAAEVTAEFVFNPLNWAYKVQAWCGVGGTLLAALVYRYIIKEQNTLRYND